MYAAPVIISFLHCLLMVENFRKKITLEVVVFDAAIVIEPQIIRNNHS